MREIVVIGGGAAGFFAAITAARACTDAGHKARVTLLEKGAQFLTKVRISGGGRCNVTHSCFDPRALSTRYPRGERALISPFHRFQPTDTIAWFAARGVSLKTEADGRMFPTTDSSQTIIDCLMHEAQEAGVNLRTRAGVTGIEKLEPTGHGDAPRFRLHLQNGETLNCHRLLLATGGAGSAGNPGSKLAASLGHTIEPPVPSLFTFHIAADWLIQLAGLSVDPVEATVPGTKLKERGPLLATHWGASGPVILRLSAWGARELHRLNYTFPLRINWLPGLSSEAIANGLQQQRDPKRGQPGALVAKNPAFPLPARLWEQLALQAGVAPDTRWAILPKPVQSKLATLLQRTELQVTGKSTNKAEFVTCGGVRLSEVQFKTMESKLTPGLYFAGELLDIDGITGGFNFQAAWTTGWIAGHAMAEA